MARVTEPNQTSVDDVQSRLNITIDLTDSAQAEGSIPVTISESGPLRPAAAGPDIAVGRNSDGFERWANPAAPTTPEELPLPRFILGEPRSVAKTRGAVAAVYRWFDLVLAGVLLLALAPLMIVTAVAVKLDSPGPVFYRHQRRGKNGRALGVLKFRSMVVDADAMIEEARQAVLDQDGTTVDAPTFKSADDPRVTRVGRFLRRSGIDEIPQLFNVIAGQMSVVGPRPLVDEEVALLSPADATLRHMIRPGITCLWQVYRTAHTSFAERMQMDLLYVKQRSLRLYLTLVVVTPLALFKGRGAY